MYNDFNVVGVYLFYVYYFLVRLGDYIVNLCVFYFYNLIGKLTTFFQSQEISFRYLPVVSSTTVVRCSPQALRINIDDVPIVSKSHTHPSRSQTSH
jgi:hypothetical protein